MNEGAYVRILKQVGGVLLVVGLIDIGVMIYCAVNHISYSSSFNVFAVIAGIFLLRGSLGAASVVRWFAVFLLAATISVAVAWPLVQPVDLTRTQFRLNPDAFTATVALMAFLFAMLLWVIRQLSSEPVLAAQAAGGRKVRDMRIPAILGIGLVVLLFTLLNMLMGGQTGEHAKAMARQQLGAGFHYHVSSLNINTGGGLTSVDGMVTAWNEKEIRQVRVQWQERH